MQLASFSMFAHYNDMKSGVVTANNLVYFASVVGFGLFVTSVVIRSKRS